MPRALYTSLLGLAGILLAGRASAQVPAPKPPPAAPPAAPKPVYPTKDRFGRPLPALTFYCQYLGLALDSTRKYPLYRNELFTIATSQLAVQNAWKAYIETTYPQTSPGNPMCALVSGDSAQRAASIKSVDLLKQPATQRVVKVEWKP